MTSYRDNKTVFAGKVLLHALVVLTLFTALSVVNPATSYAVGAPEIQQVDPNIVSSVSVDGETFGYGWAVGVSVTADFGVDGPSAGDIEMRVDGEALVYVEGFEVSFYDPDNGDARVEISGSYGADPGAEPFLGVYSVWVQDDAGAESTYVIGPLVDIPDGGPQIIAGVGPVSSTPTFSWLPFQSDYDGTPVDSWAYELNLGTPEGHWVFPIDPSKTTVAFDDLDWMPGPPEALAPGIYDVTLHSNHAVVTNADGALVINFEHHVAWQVVVSGGGFVTGGGGFTSPMGAYQADPEHTGRVNFGFNVKVKKNDTAPSGNFNFQLHSASFKFQASDFEWLIVTDDTAQFTGSGTVNGAGHFGFFASVTDGSPDSMVIDIWDIDEDRPVYGSGEMPTDLQRGNIVVHTE